jgi:hypothetical protein
MAGAGFGARRSTILSWPATTKARPGRWKQADLQEGRDP